MDFVMPGLDYAARGGHAAMQFRVLGPDTGGPGPADIRRLFRGQRLSAARRSRLVQSGRILAMCGSRVVGLAAFERTERELRVTELGMDEESICRTDEIVGGLLDALELACMASGARRLVLLPRASTANAVLRSRGYSAIAGSTSGTWLEKTFA